MEIFSAVFCSVKFLVLFRFSLNLSVWFSFGGILFSSA